MDDIKAALSLTIAVPTYNRAEKLTPLLESIRAQAAPDDELIVCDDGSRDETADVVRGVSPFRLVRHESNVGMVANWNACLREATREWVCIIHDDDTLMPGGLDLLKRFCLLANGPALIAAQPLGLGLDHALRYRKCEPGGWAAWNCPSIPSGAVVHRAIVDAVGDFDPLFSYSADLEYFARICAKFPSFCIESPTVVRYNLHGRNHQFHTWRQPDFYDQYVHLNRTVLQHAQLDGALGEALLQSRLDGALTYMLYQATQLKDRRLIRSVGRRLWRRSGAGKATRLRALAGALSGWTPSFQIQGASA